MNIQGGNLISQIKRLSDRIFERILANQNIDTFNGAQGRILYVLWQTEHISLRELSDRTGLAATTLTSMIDRIEHAGLIRRIPDKTDRRKTLLTLTDTAKGLEKDYMAVSEQMTEIFYAGFSREEILQCEMLLGRIHENLKHHISIRKEKL
ncbi:MarR family transcriptional regulator [Lachnospiraceae bacterium 42-17]|jgi:DNA-binding MarR family transcriptional regulator|nr:MarR family transcriptional regulator [Dorea sp.]